MSEPVSLHARLSFEPQNFQAFLDSAPTPRHAYDDWQAWLSQRGVHGGPIPREMLQGTGVARVGDLLQAWQADTASGMPPFALDANGRCTLTLMQTTDNYFELVQFLAPLRGAAFWTRPEADDFILATGFLFGDSEPMACIALRDGRSQFLDAVPAPWQREAEDSFEGALALLTAASD